MKKDFVRDNFVEKVVRDPLFQKQRRLSEFFDLEKAHSIHAEMTPQPVPAWANSLLMQFFLHIRGGEKVYRLELQNDLLSLIARKNTSGNIYKDSQNLLNQTVCKKGAEDLFEDDEPEPGASRIPQPGSCDKPKAKKVKAEKQINATIILAYIY